MSLQNDVEETSLSQFEKFLKPMKRPQIPYPLNQKFPYLKNKTVYLFEGKLNMEINIFHRFQYPTPEFSCEKITHFYAKKKSNNQEIIFINEDTLRCFRLSRNGFSFEIGGLCQECQERFTGINESDLFCFNCWNFCFE